MQRTPTPSMSPAGAGRILAALALFLAAASSHAQSILADLKMDHDAYVQFEAQTLNLTLANQGGSPFIVDDYGDHARNSLRVLVKSQEDGYLEARTQRPFGAIMVMPGETEVFQANLADLFHTTKPGRYFAQVVVQRGEEQFATRQVMLDVVNGIEIGSTSRPLPEYDTLSRKYTLLYWPRDQVEVLFLRIDEIPPGQCVGLVQLGNVIRYTPPRIEFSPDGATLTVLHQSSRDLFVRTVLKTDRNNLDIVDRQQLVDPNPSPMARAAARRLEEERKTASGNQEGDGFVRRVHPSPESHPEPTTP